MWEIRDEDTENLGERRREKMKRLWGDKRKNETIAATRGPTEATTKEVLATT